jgi:hypothetical protein
MIKRYLILLILALPVALGDAARAAINNGGGPSSVKDNCGTGFDSCIVWCNEHNTYGKNILKCSHRCSVYWCTGKLPYVRPGSPKSGTNAGPINGKPVEAPPPRGRDPTNAAPIISGKPVEAGPGGPETNHPILERGGGGGGGRR